MANNDLTIRSATAAAAKEIKASAHYAYITNGITLDGSTFAVGELVESGQCLVKDDVTGKYEKYTETTPGTFEPGKSSPVIMDENVMFVVKDDGTNPDVTAGEVLVHGAVYTGMLTSSTAAFIAQLQGFIRFV